MKNISFTLFQNTELLPILLVCFLFVIVVFFVFHLIQEKEMDSIEDKNHSIFHHTSSYPKWTKIDYRNLLLVTGCYAIVSFWHLGSTTFPTTTWQPTSEDGAQDVVFHLTDETQFDAIYTIYCEGDNNSLESGYRLNTEGMSVYGSNDNQNWTKLVDLEKGSIYAYQINEGNWNYEYVWLHCSSPNSSLTEFALRNISNDGFIDLEISQDNYSDSLYPATLLIDEQDKLVLYPTYEDESYFDEIYHPRNAAEIANNQDMYASVHPLLGTNIIALFIKLFGFSPFIYRLPGVLFGILLVPVFYAISRRLFKKTSLSTIASILLSADFMHITTSRIATLEPFSVFWILVMFYFMIRYVQYSWFDTPFSKQLKYLFLSGLTMGVAIATKWTTCYSAVGLAIILFSYFFYEYLQYRKAKQLLKQEQPIPSEYHEAIHIKKVFKKKLFATILLCFVFFIFIPIVIYCISYLPDRVWKGDSWSIQNVWKQVMYMYNYHIDLDATHPYSSTWDQWLLDLRPIWYYIGTDSEGFKHTIACFSNPLMTWTALFTIIFTLIDFIRTRKANAFIILVGYITALAPWIIITRCVFAYHFYPTSFFAILSIVYFLQYIWKYKVGKLFTIIYLLIYVGIFMMFLPITCGFSTSETFIKSLEWFSTWYFG